MSLFHTRLYHIYIHVLYRVYSRYTLDIHTCHCFIHVYIIYAYMSYIVCTPGTLLTYPHIAVFIPIYTTYTRILLYVSVYSTPIPPAMQPHQRIQVLSLYVYIYTRTSLHSYTSISNIHVYFSLFLYFLRQHPLSLSPTSFSRYYLIYTQVAISIHLYIIYEYTSISHIHVYFSTVCIFVSSIPSVVKPHQLLQVLSSYVYTCIHVCSPIYTHVHIIHTRISLYISVHATSTPSIV